MKAKNKIPKTKPKINSDDKKEFPGYPLYDSKEDIMNQGKRVDADIEDTKLTNNKTNITITNQSDKITNQSDSIDGDEENEISTDPYAVTKEDMEALGSEELEELNMDGGDDEGLKHRINPVDFSGEDLDVPGNELDNDSEAIGSEDEENNNYSLGGESHRDLEEDHS